LATIFFGASSLALIIFSLLLAGAAIIEWQAVKENIKQATQAANRAAETVTGRLGDLEKEIRGRKPAGPAAKPAGPCHTTRGSCHETRGSAPCDPGVLPRNPWVRAMRPADSAAKPAGPCHATRGFCRETRGSVPCDPRVLPRNPRVVPQGRWAAAGAPRAARQGLGPRAAGRKVLASYNGTAKGGPATEERQP
jgi:hypothetical protein